MQSLSDRVGHISDPEEAVAFLTENAAKIIRVRYMPPGVQISPVPLTPAGKKLLALVGMVVELQPDEPNNLDALARGVCFTEEVSNYLLASGIFERLNITPERLVVPPLAPQT